MKDSKFSKLFSAGTPEKEVDEAPLADEHVEEDFGKCAAIAKDRWVTALTIKSGKGDWKSFLYRGMDTEAEYTPATSFRLRFVGESDTKEVTVTGRNLERIYTLCLQGRMEWLRVADHDYAKDKEMIILGIIIRKVEEPKEKK